MYYILHEKNSEFKIHNIEYVIRHRDINEFKILNSSITIYNKNYCFDHYITEDFEKNIIPSVDENLIETDVRVYENLIKICFWKWNSVLSFERDEYENENQGYELYKIKK
jgi:hemolysin-activating ACP:hemolysin acyltransferase